MIASLALLSSPSLLFTQTLFEEKALEVGIDHYFQNGNLMGGGVAIFDFNQDGWEDIWINGGGPRDVLYQNKGDGTFREMGATAGLGITHNYNTTGVVTGDIDNDGLRDVFITTRADTPNLLLKNNGDGTFSNISDESGIGNYTAWSTTAAFADVDLDGFLDIYVGNYVQKFGYIADREQGILAGYDHECQPNFLFLNNQDGTFSEVGQTYSVADKGCALASTFTDFDNDRDLDLMVVNDYGEWVLPNSLLINQQSDNNELKFKAIADSAAVNVGIYAMGVAIGDYDKDNDLDYYITNLGRNVLLQNQGNGTFIDTTQFAAIEDTYAGTALTVGWGTTFLDVDNDSDLDLFVANGFIPTLSFNTTSLENEDKLFINQGYTIEKGGVTFTDESKICGIGDASTARGLAQGDFDNDGDLDLVIVRVNGTNNPDSRKRVLYYENQLHSDNNWLKVKVQGEKNEAAYGTHLRIVVNGESWVTEINGGSSHASQNSSIVHFGLGTAEIVDSLIINYLNGTAEILTAIPVNQQLFTSAKKVGTTSITSLAINSGLSLKIAPNPMQTQSHISFYNPNKNTIFLTVLDALGNTIIQQQTTENQLTLARGQLTTGLYWLQAQTASGISDTIKFLVP